MGLNLGLLLFLACCFCLARRNFCGGRPRQGKKVASVAIPAARPKAQSRKGQAARRAQSAESRELGRPAFWFLWPGPRELTAEQASGRTTKHRPKKHKTARCATDIARQERCCAKELRHSWVHRSVLRKARPASAHPERI